ncbi:hypothetical protein H072_4768 [Dactylellina haptotyla CBS 200.50]|uniref:Uncharacterized protein n=1 Tax=Dactylellina haptotyla (strain CBS 200.50) TaxID=1284197 RepID=S8AEC4_DACHA|nr:hypothetical protein H072_4768 [Dactylellina haptotyla CBS 200.50]
MMHSKLAPRQILQILFVAPLCSAFHMMLKWVGASPLNTAGLIDEKRPMFNQAGIPICRSLRPPEGADEGLVEAVSILNGFDLETMPAVAFWLGPGCAGDPQIFIRWINAPSTKMWELVDFNRLLDGYGDQMVAPYRSWRPILARELNEAFIDYRHPSGLNVGGYAIVDGDVANPIREAPFIGQDAGSGPIVQYGVLATDTTVGQASLEGLGVLLSIHFPDANVPTLPSRSKTEIPSNFGSDIVEIPETQSSHLRFQIKDKTMPVLREKYNGDFPGFKHPPQSMIPSILEDLSQGSEFFAPDDIPTNTGPFFGDRLDLYWKNRIPPVPQQLLDHYTNNLEMSSNLRRPPQSRYPGAGPAMQQLLNKLDIKPGRDEPQTVEDILLKPSFFSDLFRGPTGSNPYATMGLDPFELANAYRAQQVQNFNDKKKNQGVMAVEGTNPPDLNAPIRPDQLSNLIGQRIFPNYGGSNVENENIPDAITGALTRTRVQPIQKPVRRVFRKLQMANDDQDPEKITVMQEEGVEERPAGNMIAEEDPFDSPDMDLLAGLDTEQEIVNAQDTVFETWNPSDGGAPHMRGSNWMNQDKYY